MDHKPSKTIEDYLQVMHYMTRDGATIIGARLAERIGVIIVETWPGYSADDANLISENLVRLAISHVTAPTGSRDETAARVGRLIGPFIDESFGTDS